MRKTLKKLLPHSILKFLRRLKSGSYSYFLWLFPIKSNKIVICNYYGHGYGDNGKYIAEEIIKKGYEYQIVWLLKKELLNNAQFPPQICIVEYGTLRGLYELATAKIWIDNNRKKFIPPKRKNQIYIQTWHGGIALKRIEKDVERILDSSYVDAAKYDSKIADIFISNSGFCTKMYKSAFWYNGSILEYGSPRCDILINKYNSINEKVRGYYSIDSNSKILIYAPTFRDNYDTKVYDIDFNNLIKVLNRKYGGDWTILVRLHPNISSQSNFIKYTFNIINATDYDDMYELLSVSNILITDYSSTMFEFSFSNKPVILYASDIGNYVHDRNFYMDIYSLPYPLAEDNNQLFNILENFDEKKYLKDLNVFLSKLDVFEHGDASTKIVETIHKIINGTYREINTVK